MHFIAILIIVLKCLQAYVNKKTPRTMDLSVLEENKHKHGHTPGASIFYSSSRYQIGAWHRAAACVSRSFISYARWKELKASCTAGYMPSLSNPLPWAAHIIQPLEDKLSLPPVVVSPGDIYRKRYSPDISCLWWLQKYLA